MISSVITYLLMFLYYSFFWLAVFASSKSNSGKLKDVLSGKGDYGSLLCNLLAGIFFLGLGTIVLIKRNGIDTNIIEPSWNPNYSIWILIIISLLLGLSSALKKTKNNNATQPLPLHLPLAFVFVRILFLIVYEFFFRGAMLFITVNDLGIPFAIVCNLIFYLLAHWFDKQEKYGSLIMGPVLCIVTIYQHSVWPAIFIHLSLALSFEITLLIKYKSFSKKSFA